MRAAVLAASTLFLTAALGCSVLEEIDAAHSAMNIGEKPTGRSESGPETDEKRGIDWTTSRSINTGQINPDFVSCKLGSATQFMRKDDCLTRGGAPKAL